MIFSIRALDMEHITLGRFDRYMLPFYERDLQRGVSREELQEITLKLGELTDDEREIILKGCLINYNRA